MASRSTTFKELQSLQNELGTGRRERQPTSEPPSPGVQPPADGPGPVEPASPPNSPANGGQPGDDIGALVREATDYLEERAGDVAAHPLAIAIGGLVIGLIIGRMLPRR